VWWLGFLLLPLTYLRTRRHKPEAVLVEQDGRIYGAMTISVAGEVRNGVMLGDPRRKHEAMKLLMRAMAAYVREPQHRDRTFRARTLSANESLIKAAGRVGSRGEPAGRVLVTLPLGPLTYSWLSSRVPRWRRLRSRPLVDLILTPAGRERIEAMRRSRRLPIIEAEQSATAGGRDAAIPRPHHRPGA
jgi:hypothetical protein